MRNMDSYSMAAMARTMKIQEVLLRAMARKITWFQAAEILGFTDRHVRRIREREGTEGGHRTSAGTIDAARNAEHDFRALWFDRFRQPTIK